MPDISQKAVDRRCEVALFQAQIGAMIAWVGEKENLTLEKSTGLVIAMVRTVTDEFCSPK